MKQLVTPHEPTRDPFYRVHSSACFCRYLFTSISSPDIQQHLTDIWHYSRWHLSDHHRDWIYRGDLSNLWRYSGNFVHGCQQYINYRNNTGRHGRSS